MLQHGYHYTTPLKLVYKELPAYCFKVVCAINDRQLAAGFLVLSVLYLSGIYTGLLVLKVFSFMPVIYLLFFYYLNRKEFIRLIPVLN